MSEHTPLTEAERELLAKGWPDFWQVHAAVESILAARTSTATADGDLGMVCDAYGLPHNAVALARHIESNAALTIEVQKDTIRLLQARAATADTGLRERVEALADEWEGWAKNRSTPRIDAFRDAAEHLRSALDATPASTEDRADNEGTR